MAAAGWLAARSREAAAAAALTHLRPPPPSPQCASCGPADVPALPKCAGVLCKLAATASTPERGGDLQAGVAASQQRVSSGLTAIERFVMDGYQCLAPCRALRVQMACLPDASSAAPWGLWACIKATKGAKHFTSLVYSSKRLFSPRERTTLTLRHDAQPLPFCVSFRSECNCQLVKCQANNAVPPGTWHCHPGR